MDFLKRMTVLFLVVINFFIAITVLLFIFNQLDTARILHIAWLSTIDHQYKLGVGIGAGVILFFNFLLYRLFSVRVRRHKIIAFDNPSGRVSVSLNALEDMVKRLLSKSPEIKESKTNIIMFRKKLYVQVHLALLADVNIPGIIARLQNAVTRKIQDAIGIEETIEVTVYVGKIIPLDTNDKGKSDKDRLADPLPPTNVPYHGYRP